MSAPVNRLVSRFLKTMELPTDVVLELPHLSVIGNRELSVENHRGIEKYTAEEIALRFKGGRLEICGRQLGIDYIEKDAIKIKGIIEKIFYVNL